MDATELRLDYFSLYWLENPPTVTRRPLSMRLVQLKTQFDKEPVTYVLDHVRGFFDRANKNDEKLFNPNAHLLMYAMHPRVEAPPVRRRVVAANQFVKEQNLEIRNATHLLAPCLKWIAPIPPPVGTAPQLPKLDHYVVYMITEATPVETPPIQLRDQFSKRKTQVYRPIAFAAPVWKRHAEKVHPIINERAHLVIYHTDTSEDVPAVIGTVDQFFAFRGLRLGVSLYLAVPSLKLHWE